MYAGQPEKELGTVLVFGEKGQFAATSTPFIRSLTAPGGATAVSTEFAVVIPRNGRLKNLFWSAESSTLSAAGNRITINLNGSPTGLAVIWSGGGTSGANTAISIPVAAGDKVSVYMQLATGQTGKVIVQPRVSIELEVDAQNPNPWDLTGSIVSYAAGAVGIGTSSPAGELHVKNAAAGGVAGIFETASGKILSGRVGATEKFNVDAAGNLYVSGKVGIGNTTPATELDVNGTVRMLGVKLPTGAGNGLVLTSDASGNGAWAPTGGAANTLAGNGTVNAIPLFLGPTTLNDSVIFQDGGSIGIGTSTPVATLEVNGTVQLGGSASNPGVSVDLAGNVGIGTASPQAKLDVGGAISGFGIVPIGSIVAWHKSLSGTPALPGGWVECNGQTLNDPTSPFHNRGVPDLNGSGRFLRGSATSGALQPDAFQGHKMQSTLQVVGFQTGGGGLVQGDYWNQTPLTSTIVDDGHGAPRIADETRPINMSVVWIMRVK